MDSGAYLCRIGIDPDAVETPDFESLARLQRAHVETIPFENLSITGDPRGRVPQNGVELARSTLYEKIVEQQRGGYCFELNGLFCWLLGELGYDARRVAARVLSGGGPGIPANHHSIIAELDRSYVVDVGMGTPKLGRPVPIDGEAVAGTTSDWRVVPDDRPQEDYRLEVAADDADWSGRYVFTTDARDLAYFRPANDYLQTARDSPFTGTHHLSIATPEGYVKCADQELTVVDGSSEHRETLSTESWYDHLDSTFGLELQH